LTTLKQIFPILLLTIASLAWTTPAIPTGHDVAQDPTPTPTENITPQPGSGPIYVIQPGDSLSSIASRFGVLLNDLLNANNITDANNISVGTQIIIPGLEGVSGVLTTEIIGYGDTLHSLSRRNQISEDLLRQLNHITSPAELYAGVSLVYPEKDNFTPLTNRISLAPGETLLEASVLAQTDPSTLVALNGLQGNWAALPGDVLYAPGEAPAGTGPNGMPSALISVKVSPVPIKQGGTSTIVVQAAPGVTLGGTLVDKPLHFFPLEDGKQVALQGIHAMLDPGPYPLTLEATLPDGAKQTFEQMVIVQAGYYPEDPLLTVEPATIDPAVNDPELQKITDLTAPDSPQKLWQGAFKNPSVFPDCFTSRYGNRRTYIGEGTNEKFYSFHSGLDFCGGIGLQIVAPADGVVVFAGPLTVRGNATIIDHGWGVYSGIWHQSQINVQVGQVVKAGDVIGLVGATGRVTGAHLHWEVWVNGIQVDPMDWLENSYP
jgi:murein DD-endopeptidase MepM/ murein hydrolase activator NlpD